MMMMIKDKHAEIIIRRKSHKRGDMWTPVNMKAQIFTCKQGTKISFHAPKTLVTIQAIQTYKVNTETYMYRRAFAVPIRLHQ